MTLEKPEQDGKVILHWLDPTSEAKVYLFGTQLRMHKAEVGFLFLQLAPKRQLYIPWSSLRMYEVIPNSEEYMEAIEAWSGEDHRNHTGFVQECTMCLETFHSNNMASSKVIYLSPGDDN